MGEIPSRPGMCPRCGENETFGSPICWECDMKDNQAAGKEPPKPMDKVHSVSALLVGDNDDAFLQRQAAAAAENAAANQTGKSTIEQSAMTPTIPATENPASLKARTDALKAKLKSVSKTE